MRSTTLLALAALGLTSALPATAGTLLVPQQFPTIQAALNAAKPHDTVLVSAKPKGGVYNESVTITTPYVTLQGLNNPIIDGTGLGIPAPNPFDPGFFPSDIEIRASHVAVRGMTVQNSPSFASQGGSGINVGSVTPDGQTDVSYGSIEISSVTARNNFIGITINGASGADPRTGGTPTMLKNYLLVNDVVTGSTNSGLRVVNVSGAVITACKFTANGGDGLDTSGTGVTVTASESAANANYGMALNASTYNPAVNDPKKPNPAPSTAFANSIHDNLRFGLSVSGTEIIVGNSIANNVSYGVSLFNADYSAVTFNVITGTASSGGFGPADDGTGLVANGNLSNLDTGPSGHVTISGNTISSNASDGLFLESVVGCTVSLNTITGNAEVGIHASDYPTTLEGIVTTIAPNVITLNRAVHNTVFDARDDASATDPLVYVNPTYSFLDVTYTGDGVPTHNIWKRNLFGTTDPIGLSK